MARGIAAAGVIGALFWATAGGGAAAASPIVVTAGSQQITFSGSPKSGALGSVDGYDSLGFDFESGRAGMFGDVQIGSDASGNATLSGTLAVVPSSDTLASTPSSSTVTVSVGQSLLVVDSAGNYVLVQVTNATSQTVWFSYTIQSSVTTVQAPAPQSQTQGSQTSQSQTATPSATPSAQTGTGSQQTQSSSQGSAASSGVYAITGNCLTVADSSGQGALGVGIELTPMFSGQSIADAEQHMELVLNVAISAPSDVTNVSVQQSGQVGSYGYTQKLMGYGQSGGGIWPFSMQQTSTSDVYQILITSQTLAADGIANPGTGVTEVDWSFNTTQGCGSGGTQTQSQSTQSTQSSRSSSSQSGSSPVTIELQIGSTTASVNGQTQALIAPAQTDAAGRTLVPFRFLGQALGATVSWDGGSHTASYQLGATDVAVTIGSRTATVNGRSLSLDAPPVIVGGSTLVPVRFISEALGAQVGWDASTRTVTITYPAP